MDLEIIKSANEVGGVIGSPQAFDPNKPASTQQSSTSSAPTSGMIYNNIDCF